MTPHALHPANGETVLLTFMKHCTSADEDAVGAAIEIGKVMNEEALMMNGVVYIATRTNRQK